MYKLRFDGACKGNPGICGAGFLIYKGDEVIYKDCAVVSLKNTNNYAEYSAILLGIKKALELDIKSLTVEGDSNLVINQLNQKYEVRSENLKPLYEKIIESLIDLDEIIFEHIYRTKNTEADRLANLAIKKYYSLDKTTADLQVIDVLLLY
tara:strand:- start:157 stop:609 length:453 start_codon:yes stop_codon:yes gene_type:complete